MTTKIYLNLADLAALTNLSYEAVRKRRSRGTLPPPDIYLGVTAKTPGWSWEIARRWVETCKSTPVEETS